MLADSSGTQQPVSEVAEQLRGLFESAAVGVIQSDIDGHITNVNQTFCEMIGYDRAEIIGRLHSDFVHLDHKAPPQEFSKLIRGEISRYDRRKQYLRRDGTPVWTVVSVSLQKEGTDGQKYTINVIRDITEQKRTEDALQAELEDNKRLQEVSTRLISSNDVVTLFKQIVAAAVDITRADRGTLQLFEAGTGKLRLLTAQGMDRRMTEKFQFVSAESQTSCSEAMRLGKRVIVTNFETDRLFAGTESAGVHIESNILAAQSTPLLNRSGHLVGMISTHWSRPHQPQERQLRLLDILARQAADLIDRANSETALRESEERYRAIVESQSEMVSRFRSDGTILFVNGAYAHARNATAEALTGVKFWDFISEDDRPGVRAMLDRLRPESPEVTIENRFETSQGVRWTMWTNRALVFDADSRAMEVQSSGIDITDRKRAEMRLVAEQAVSQVLATSRTLDQAAPLVLDALCRSLNVDIAELWRPTDDGQSIYCAHLRTSDTFTGGGPWEELTRPVRFKPWEVLPGRVWASKSPQWFLDFEAAPEGPRKSFAISLGLRSNVGFPLLAGQHCMGVITLHTREQLVEDDLLQDSLSSLGRDIAQFMLREQAERALRENEERLRLAAEAGGIGAWDWDIAAGKISWSDMQERIFGLPAGSFDGTIDSLLKLVHTEDRDRLQQVMMAFDNRDRRIPFQYRIVRPDGEVRWIHSTGAAVRDGEGKPVRVFGVVTDITGQKRREEAQRFLLEASDILSSSMDYNDTLRRVAEIAARSIADWCRIDLLEAGAVIRRVVIAHRDPEKVKLAQEAGDRYPPDPDFINRVVAMREPVLVPHLTEEILFTIARDDEHLRVMKDLLNLRSVIVVPIAAGEQAYGVLRMAAAESGHIFDSTDLATAQELAYKCALAITSSRLHSEMRDSEERYRASFENAAVGITHVGLDRKVIAVNRKFCEITGYTKEELAGTDIFEITPEEARTCLPQAEALYSGDVPHIEAEETYLHRDGHPVWTKSTITVQRDSTGKPLYRISIIEDITGRKRAEKRLAAEHAVSQVIGTAPTLDEAAPRMLRALCDSYGLAIGELWVSDDEGKTIYCSCVHTSENLGEGAAQWREDTLSMVVNGKSNLLSKVWRRKRPAWRLDVHADPTLLRKDLLASIGIVSHMAFPLMAGHRCMGIVFLHARRKMVEDSQLEDSLSSLGRDIGQFMLRTQTESALRESETLFRAAANATNDVIWDWDMRADRVRWNASLEGLFGYRTDGAGTPEGWRHEKVHPDDRERVFDSIQAAIAAGHDRWNGEYRLRKANGSYAHVLDRGYFIRDADGAVARMIGAMQDVTARKELAETLIQANATLEQRVQERTAELEALTSSLRLLAARLSQVEQRERRRLAELIHDDLQQLLVAARMQVNAARASSIDNSPGDSRDLAVSLLDQAIEEARSLTTQLRPPALYESGLAASLGWLASWMQQAHGFAVDLKVDTPADSLPEQDAVTLFDSVREMLLNSVKYSGASRASVIMSAASDEWLRLSVSDSGIGFDVSVLDGPRTDSGGFGLFGIRERVAATGGRFEVRSAPGKGATFDLFWPRSAPESTVRRGLESHGRETGLTGHPGGATAPAGQISVLLVDDHALVRQSLADVLSRQPDIAVTAEASDGEQAVEAVEMYRPDVVVMDVNLPKLNGVQATRIIKQHHGVLIIGVSVHNDPATRQAMLDAGASAYLSKDGPVETLVETIRRQVQLMQNRR